MLEVMASGSTFWRLEYHLNGKREKVTLGAYPAFTIRRARDRHEDTRAPVERGQSPVTAWIKPTLRSWPIPTNGSHGGCSATAQKEALLESPFGGIPAIPQLQNDHYPLARHEGKPEGEQL